MGGAYRTYGVECTLYYVLLGTPEEKKTWKNQMQMKFTLKNVVTRCGLDSSG